MAKKKKSANPSAAKQSREQLLSQQKNGTEKKEEVKVPEKSEMEAMREKREAKFGALSKAAPPGPAVKPTVAATSKAAPRPAGPPSNAAPKPAGPSSTIAPPVAPACTHTQPSPAQGVLTQELAQSLGHIRNWTDVFNLTLEKRRQWFNVVPGAEAAYSKVLEDARRKHALALAEKGKGQASTAPAAPATQNGAGPSRVPLPAFTSPAFSTDSPIPQPITAPTSIPNGRQPYHNPLAQNPVSGPNAPKTLQEQVQFLTAENEDMRSIMLQFKKVMTDKGPERITDIKDAVARSGRHLVNAEAQSAETAKQSQELEHLHSSLNRLSAETGKIKQENENHLVELNAIRADVETLRKENTRLGLVSFKDKATREALEDDKAKLEAEVAHLTQMLEEKDVKLVEAERVAKHYQEECDRSTPLLKELADRLRETDEERRKFRIRLDAVKLLVLQDDLAELIPDLNPTPVTTTPVAPVIRDGTLPEEPHIRSLTPNSILPPIHNVGDAQTPVEAPSRTPLSGPTWSREIKERARSQESVKLLKVAWKLAAMERIVLPSAAGSPQRTASTPDVPRCKGGSATQKDKVAVKPEVKRPHSSKGKETQKYAGAGSGSPVLASGNGNGISKQGASTSTSPFNGKANGPSASTSHAQYTSINLEPIAPAVDSPRISIDNSKSAGVQESATIDNAIASRETEAIPVQSIEYGNAAADSPKNANDPFQMRTAAESLPSLMPSAMPREDTPSASAASVSTGLKFPVIWGDLMDVEDAPDVTTEHEIADKAPESPPVDSVPEIQREPSTTVEQDTDANMSPEPPVIPGPAETTTDSTSDLPCDPIKTTTTATPVSPSPAEISKDSTTDLLSNPIKATSTSSKFTITTAFCATSRKVRGGKRNIATTALDKFLRQKRLEHNQGQRIAARHTAKSEIATGSASATGGQDEARTTARRTTITDLPNEIIEAIAQHLRPPYEPIEEMSTERRVVIWEQDDIFYPHWGKDLFGLAATCKRFRKLLYDRNRFGCIQVADSEEALKSMVKNMPRAKRELVKALIIGNAIYVHEDAVTPYYLEALEAFPNLTAIQHRPCNEMGASAGPFQYRPLDSLDICVPDLMCETPFAPPDKFVSTKVKSFTMRENNWWMLYNDMHAGPQGGRCREYFDNICQHFTGIERLNLFPILIHEQTPFPDAGTPGENSATWITLKNLPQVRTLNLRFDMAHKFRTEDVASLPRLEHILTNFSPLLRHVKITMDLMHPQAVMLFLASLQPRINVLRPRDYWSYVTKHYIPTPERIQEFARTLAKHIPGLKTFQFLIYDHEVKDIPLFDYRCKVSRTRKSEPGKPGAFRLEESTMNRLHRRHIDMTPIGFD